MPKYLTKPKIVEAFQLEEKTRHSLADALGPIAFILDDERQGAWIRVNRGNDLYQVAKYGDWIVATDSPIIFQVYTAEEFWNTFDKMHDVS